MKIKVRIIAITLLIITTSILMISCQSRGNKENLPTVNEEEKVVTISDYMIGDETLLYTAKTEELRYIKFKNCITISECISDNPNITIPASIEGLPVVAIERYSFAGRKALERLTIGPNMVFIGAYAFAECTSLKTVIMSGSVSEIKEGAFSNCKSLTSIIIPASVDTVPSSCFGNCSALAKVVIESRTASSNKAVREKTEPRTLDSAFTGCTSLSAIWIPADITEISSSLLGGSRRTIVFSEAATAAARFAAYEKLDFGITTRDEFDAAVRKYNPIEQEMTYDQIGKTVKTGKFDIKLKNVQYFEKLGSVEVEDGERIALVVFDIINNANYNNYFDGINSECASWARDQSGIMRTYTKRPLLISPETSGYSVPAGTFSPGEIKTCATALKISAKSVCISLQFPGTSEAFYINTKN